MFDRSFVDGKFRVDAFIKAKTGGWLRPRFSSYLVIAVTFRILCRDCRPKLYPDKIFLAGCQLLIPCPIENSQSAASLLLRQKSFSPLSVRVQRELGTVTDSANFLLFFLSNARMRFEKFSARGKLYSSFFIARCIRLDSF